MTAALSTLHHSQSLAHPEITSRLGIRRPAARSIDFDLGRSRASRHRHRVLISAQYLTAFFDYQSDHKQSFQEGDAVRL
jgi:hypothetical protein